LLNDNSPTTVASQGDLGQTPVINERVKQLSTDEIKKFENSIVIEDDSDDDIIILSPSLQGKARIGEKLEQNLNAKRQAQVELNPTSLKKLHTATTRETICPEKSDASSEDKVEKAKVPPLKLRVLKSFWGPNTGYIDLLLFFFQLTIFL